jgi:ubiquinone/menaquinone biosynthesis C-methylase UbiE
LPVADKQFNVVVSVDALEHVARPQRAAFLGELVRVCRSTLLINTPAARSMEAQRIVFALTGHRFIGEHVNLVLPSADETKAQLYQFDANISISVIELTSIAAWMPWFVLLQKDRPSAMALSTVLKQNSDLSNRAPYLYDLLVCTLAPLGQ